MQRLLSLRLVSKNSRNLPNNGPSYYSKTFLSFPKTNPIQPHNTYRHFFSDQSSSLSHSWPTSKKFFGYFSNTVLLKQFLPKSNALLRGPNKGLVDCKWVFVKGQFQRGYHYASSYKSHSRGWRWVQRLNPGNVVLGLIVTNVVVFLLWRIADRQFMRKNFMISVDNFKSGRVHTLITSAFSHIDVEHILSNMIGLYFFGTSIGGTFGSEFLLKLYLSGAVTGSVFYLLYHAFMSPSKSNQMWSIDPSNIPGLGASGAVNAIMLLDIFLHPRNTLYLDFIIPVPAILLGIFIIGKDILRIIEGDPQVSGSAHLGGAAVAGIAWALKRKGRF